MFRNLSRIKKVRKGVNTPGEIIILGIITLLIFCILPLLPALIITIYSMGLVTILSVLYLATDGSNAFLSGLSIYFLCAPLVLVIMAILAKLERNTTPGIRILAVQLRAMGRS